MEMAVDEKRRTQKVASKKGGLRTMPFIIANEAFEKVAGVGLQANMILYLRNEYNLTNASCRFKQVEELKSLIKVLPICSTGIMIAVTLNQHASPVLQATTMDRHFIGNLKIPAGSYGVLAILALTTWVAVYDRLLVPLLAKFTKRPRGLSNKQRMGIGIVVSCVATATAGAVENKRRATALRQGLADHQRAVVDMSANRLIPQHCLVGFGEAFSAIRQMDFVYSRFSKTMTSIAFALFSLGMAAGNLVGSLIIGAMDDVSRRGGKVSWVSNNLNKGHYDYYYYYYWLLSLLSLVNFFYYLLCSWGIGRYMMMEKPWKR